MQLLPIGEQDFRTLRNKGQIYVDKTEQIHRLITTVSYCFLSRPRRFGKSLTLSTIEEIFLGSRALFGGLWIEKNWDWTKTHPVLHIPFNKIGYGEIGLERALVEYLSKLASAHSIQLKGSTPGLMLTELVEKLAAAKAPVVLLIDEYDKPIIDYLQKEDLATAKSHRKILKTFYSGLKSKDSQTALRFFMITGVSKFSQVSIFSDLNYLDDLTLGKNFSTLTGYTQEELENNFEEWLEFTLNEGLTENKETLLAAIKQWYNGYSWDAVRHVYNPFSILNFFNNGSFEDYWFKTGTPSFLLALMKEQGVFHLEDLKVNKRLFDSYELENMDVRSLLFQTGYLTIKHIDRLRGQYTLDYPNREVEEAMHDHLIAALTGNSSVESTKPVLQLEEAFLNNDLERVVTVINSMLRDIAPLSTGAHNEQIYHALVHLLFRYLGLFMDSEVHTSNGRMDAVVQTTANTYIFEFKLNQSAAVAMQQIHDKRYADKFRLNGKTLVGVGVNFNTAKEEKRVDDWVQSVL